MNDRDEHLAPAVLYEFGRRALAAAGMPDDDAADTATAMVWADLRGLDAHGVSVKLPQCVARIRAGGTRPDPSLPVLRERPGTAAVDGQGSWGQVAGIGGMRAAIARARSLGVGLVSVRDTGSAAALGYFPTLAVDEGMIGMVVTNGPALIPAWGGAVRRLGNQAHAIGVPAGRHFPILFDSALTLMSTGRMDLHLERGEPLPDGVLLDSDGNPTRDPAEWTTGLLVPVGGHRGYALAVAFEILTGVLAGGARMGADVGHPFVHAEPQGVSLFCLAIDPRIAMPYEEFTARVDRLIDQVHAVPPAPGADRVYVPGERGHLTARERERTGIPVAAARAARLRALAAKLGVPAW